jgi:hypothetical protein
LGLALGAGVGLGVGCTTGTNDNGEIPAPEFGLGGKADGELCDRAADLCWPSDQQAAMRTVFAAQDRLLLGAGDAQANARLLVGGLEGLAVKLTAEESEALSSLSAEADGLGPDADEAGQRALEAAGVGQPGTTANLQARQEVEQCLTERWRALDAEDRIAVLSDLYTMAVVNGGLDPAELDRYAVYESLLVDGAGLTNFDLRDEHLDLMRQVITILLVSPEDAVPADQVEMVQSIPVDARLPFLAQVPAAHQAAVTCAYLGTCP